LIALIEQRVRRLAAARAGGDLLIEIGDLGADRVDLLHVGGDSRIHIRVQIAELRAGRVEILRERRGIAEQRLTRSRRRGVVRHRGPSAVISLQRRGQAGRAGAEQVVDLAGVALQGVELSEAALRGVQLIGGGLAECTVDSRDIHPRADRNAAGVLRRGGGEVDRFHVIARRRRVRHVVARDFDGLLKGLKRRDIDSKHI
jgi:hypothetical protein